MGLFFKRIIFVSLLGFAFINEGLCQKLSEFNQVDVTAVTKWFQIANVTLTPSSFLRQGSAYTASYKAEVSPFSFYSETGILRIPIPESELQKLANLQAILFKGTATRLDGRVRSVKGEVIPKTKSTGILHITLFYNRFITLKFDTTYNLPLASSIK